jgi:phosphoglycolate phosphatase
LKLVIFDCDGTLVDSQHMIVAAMNSAYAAHDLPAPPRERLLSIVGLSLPQAFAALGEGMPDFPVDSFVQAYKDAFFALRQSDRYLEPLFPGALDALAALAARNDVLLGVATGKSRRGVDAVLGRHGLLGHFITIKTADDAPSKPDPGMVEQAMREAGVGPERTLMVGDTVYDIAMAQAAGTAAVGVSWGYHPVEALHGAGAAAVVDTFPELIPALDRLWSDVEPATSNA